MPSRILFTDDAARALAKARDFLERDPVRNNLLLSLLTARAQSGSEPGRYWVARERGRTAGIAFQSPLDFPAVISRMKGRSAQRIVEEMHAAGVVLPGVTGDARTATRFAAEWTDRTKTPVMPVRPMRL